MMTLTNGTQATHGVCFESTTLGEDGWGNENVEQYWEIVGVPGEFELWLQDRLGNGDCAPATFATIAAAKLFAEAVDRRGLGLSYWMRDR